MSNRAKVWFYGISVAIMVYVYLFFVVHGRVQAAL